MICVINNNNYAEGDIDVGSEEWACDRLKFYIELTETLFLFNTMDEKRALVMAH